MKKIPAIFVFTFLLAAFSFGAFAQNETPQTKREKKVKEKPLPLTSQVILISLDGLQIEDLKNPKLNLPTLKYFSESGTYARNVESVYPTTSLPAHASLLTGMLPADHGITAEYLFNEQTGKSAPEKSATANEIKTDSILLAAERGGLKVAAWNFPLTENAEAKKSASASDLLTNFHEKIDLLRFDEYSAAQQKFGINSIEAITALEKIDQTLAQILAQAEKSGNKNEITWLIVSTHGNAKVEQEFRPNLLLAKKGFLTLDAQGNIKSWIATSRSSGGAAAIYLQDANNEEAIKDVQKIFIEEQEKEASALWRVIDKKSAAKLGADPRAAFFIEAAPGFLISEQTTGKKITDKLSASAPKAAAGYAPSKSEMRGFLIAAGKGIKPKTQIEYAQIIDVAPTIARLLGIELKASRGHVISSILIAPAQK